MTNQARKEEREAIVEYIEREWPWLTNFTFQHKNSRAFSLPYLIEAINRGDHWEGKDGK